RARPRGDTKHRELRADPLSRNQRSNRRRCRCLSDGARPDPAPGQGLSPAQRAAHECRRRGGEPPGGGDTGEILGEELVTTPKSPLFNRLALIGVGLIGSSIARAARAQGVVRSIAATARSPATRRRVAEIGLANQVTETNGAAVEGADLIIVCIPVGACG